MRALFFLLSLLWLRGDLAAQCSTGKPPLSLRPANYEIHVKLDHSSRRVVARQSIKFTNQSPQPITYLRLYMYLNSFKNTETTFLKGAPNVFGQSYVQRLPEEWGWIHIDSFKTEAGVVLRQRYVQPDDQNPDDESVLHVDLDKPLQPGQTIRFDLSWRAQMPKTIARAGYSKDFYLFCHWFPQLGVWEQKADGGWDWNCHQFFRTTEFYADFGVYDVHINTPKQFVLGASGCLISEKNEANGTITRHYRAEDVIDFAWAIYPRFQVLEDRWRDVQIRILYPPEHGAMAPRYLRTLRFALEWLDKHVGAYPYSSITAIDPPFHGLRSGLMEYPTLITLGTFYGTPERIRTSESLLVHEFVHQYFMGMVATNEKEEAWLDEGFTTYYEDRIIDAMFGPEHALINLPFYGFNSAEQTRLEYTTMPNPREAIVGEPGWLIKERNRKALVYSKTATLLHSVEGILGTELMDDLMRNWFIQWRFKHPRGNDFLAHVDAFLSARQQRELGHRVKNFIETGIYEAKALDYAVTRITVQQPNARTGLFGAVPEQQKYLQQQAGQPVTLIEVQRKGDWVQPVELEVTFADGSRQRFVWDGVSGSTTFEISDGRVVVSAEIDPDNRLPIDLDLNNNSMTLKPDHTPLLAYTARITAWLQNLFQTVAVF